VASISGRGVALSTAKRDLLIVTNDFPPRQGGIQSFVFELARRLPAERVAVYCSTYPGAAAFDDQLDFPVIRHRTGLLVPTPAARRRVVETARELGSRSAWFGAAAPLGLLAPALRKVGVGRQVASTHGHEVGWAMLPGARQALRRIGTAVDVVTYLGPYTERRLRGALGPRATLAQLTPGVDIETFNAQISGVRVRERFGLTGRPVIVCVSRLVPRKGQDALIAALPAIREQVPGAALLLVGRGPYENSLRRQASMLGIADDVIFTGGVEAAELSEHFAAGDVFAMPCRTRRLGMDVEGLGIVFLEASAMGLPVIAGDSGGAPDAVVDGQTGTVVDGRAESEIVAAAVGLLGDREMARAFGAAGRKWVEQRWQWDAIADRLAVLLQL